MYLSKILAYSMRTQGLLLTHVLTLYTDNCIYTPSAPNEHTQLWNKSENWTDKYRQRILFSRLKHGYEVATGFKVAREEVLSALEHFQSSGDDIIPIQKQIEKDLKSVRTALLDIQRLYSEIAASITTSVAARTVLNKQKIQGKLFATLGSFSCPVDSTDTRRDFFHNLFPGPRRYPVLSLGDQRGFEPLRERLLRLLAQFVTDCAKSADNHHTNQTMILPPSSSSSSLSSSAAGAVSSLIIIVTITITIIINIIISTQQTMI